MFFSCCIKTPKQEHVFQKDTFFGWCCCCRCNEFEMSYYDGLSHSHPTGIKNFFHFRFSLEDFFSRMSSTLLIREKETGGWKRFFLHLDN